MKVSKIRNLINDLVEASEVPDLRIYAAFRGRWKTTSDLGIDVDGLQADGGDLTMTFDVGADPGVFARMSALRTGEFYIEIERTTTDPIVFRGPDPNEVYLNDEEFEARMANLFGNPEGPDDDQS